MKSTLLTRLRDLGNPSLYQEAAILVQERNDALRESWSLRHYNEQLRSRLHEVIEERNQLRDGR